MGMIKGIVDYLRVKTGTMAKEEDGGAEIIATVIVIGVVVVLGIAFSGKIMEFFNGLWGDATSGANGAFANKG